MSAGRLFVDRWPMIADQAHGLFPLTFESGGATVDLMLTRAALMALERRAGRALARARLADLAPPPVVRMKPREREGGGRASAHPKRKDDPAS